MSYTSNGAARLIILDKSNNFSVLLTTWNDGKGNTKMGVPGGATHPDDRGDTLATLRRTCATAIAMFPFNPAMLLKMGATSTWQEGKHGEPDHALWTDWYVYLAKKEEIATILHRYGSNTPKLGIFSRGSVMQAIRDGKVVDEVHAKALLRAALCARHWGPAQKMWGKVSKQPAPQALIFRLASAVASEDYERALEVDGDWQPKLPVNA